MVSDVIADQPEIELKIKDWFDRQGWKGNPFILNIIPSIFVGYEEQKNKLIASVEENHKVCLILGPTGSGKTTALRWLMEKYKKDKKIVRFISKPPDSPEGLVEIFNEMFRPPWFLRPFISHIKIRDVQQIPEYLNRKLKNKKLVILFDESHEASVSVLQWLRVFVDQVENLSLVLSGLPIFEDILARRLETFQKRITTRIALKSLTKEETKELIVKRIDYVAKEPNRNNPFTDEAIDLIYRETGGFPREIIRLCDYAVNKAIENNLNRIEPELIKEQKTEKVSEFSLDNIPKRQQEIIDAIRNKKNTPNDIVDTLDLTKYKSRYHALRSVNNILKRLMEEGYIEREKRGKTYVYILSPKLKSLIVNA